MNRTGSLNKTGLQIEPLLSLTSLARIRQVCGEYKMPTLVDKCNFAFEMQIYNYRT
jgi:hypothetical protein